MNPPFEIGQRVSGHVIQLMPFGAFVAIADTNWIGLVKIPEISWHPIRHPKDVLTLGQLVEAEIITLPPEHKQVILSIKRCQEND